MINAQYAPYEAEEKRIVVEQRTKALKVLYNMKDRQDTEITDSIEMYKLREELGA